MQADKQGIFVISLDFELFWGMFDKTTLNEYGANILGEQNAIPAMLDLFKKYELHATWATVGMLMCKNKSNLENLFPTPAQRPLYPERKQSSYIHIEQDGIGNDEHDDPYHYGSTLVKKIQDTPHQEIGSHTFSHYYCLDGEDNRSEVFKSDCDAMRNIGSEYGLQFTSIVFPRNQVTDNALNISKEYGFTAYRGTENHFLYHTRKDSEQSLFIRGMRLIDHYINISGYHTHKIKRAEITNVPASRFLRPYSPTFKIFEPLRLRRIKNAMTHAAKHNEMYHLWWHPHNFGIHTKENIAFLEAILCHYKHLRNKYNMESMTMQEVVHSH